MAICGKNEALDKVKDKAKELKDLLQGGKDQLASMQAKLDGIKADLKSFLPEIPSIDSLQAELAALESINDPTGLTAKLAELKEKYGDKLPNFDGIISDLGLDSFPPEINLSNICSLVPNVVIKNGVISIEPNEPKIPEEEPVKEEPAPVVEKLEEEYNKDYMTFLYQASTKNAIAKRAKTVSTKKNIQQKFYDLTWPELLIELAAAGGSTFDDLKYLSYTEAELKEEQKKLLSKYPDITWDFKTEGQIWAKKYAEFKSSDIGANTGSFSTAATELVAKRLKKLEQS